MFQVAVGAIGNTFGHRQDVVVRLALIVALMTGLIVDRLGCRIGAGKPDQRLPGSVVARLAVGLKILMAVGDGLRQKDRMIPACCEDPEQQ